MPVRRVTQPLGLLLISAAWPGGAAVTMEARSRQAARVGRGGAGPGRAGQAVWEPGGWARACGGPPDPGRGPPDPRRGPEQALPPWSLLHPERPGVLDIKALCRRMRARSQPCSPGRASRSGRGGLALGCPVGLCVAEPGSGRQQSTGCLPLLQAPDSSCHSSRGALADSAECNP